MKAAEIKGRHVRKVGQAMLSNFGSLTRPYLAHGLANLDGSNVYVLEKLPPGGATKS